MTNDQTLNIQRIEYLLAVVAELQETVRKLENDTPKRIDNHREAAQHDRGLLWDAIGRIEDKADAASESIAGLLDNPLRAFADAADARRDAIDERLRDLERCDA